MILCLLLVPATALSTVEVDHEVTLLPEPRGSILIQSDEDFRKPVSGVRGGTGTLDDPFIISDWLISSKGDHYDIRIAGTTAHVVLEDLVLAGGFAVGGPNADITLEQAANVTVRRVAFEGGATAVRVVNSSDVRIENLQLSPDVNGARFGGFHLGALVENSLRVAFHNVDWTGALDPVRVSGSQGVEFSRSTFTNNASFPFGFFIVSDSSTIALRRNLFDKVELRFANRIENLLIEQNMILDGHSGIETHPESVVQSATICGNVFSNISTGGTGALEIHNTHGLTISGNDFVGNTVGARVQNSVNVAFSENLVADSISEGILFGNDNGTLRQNRFERNGDGNTIYGPADAVDNWWGHETGPSRDGPGLGDALRVINPPVLFDPWLRSPPHRTSTCLPTSDTGAEPFPLTVRPRFGVGAGLEVSEEVGSGNLTLSATYRQEVESPPVSA